MPPSVCTATTTPPRDRCNCSTRESLPRADIWLLCGDQTDCARPDEARALERQIASTVKKGIGIGPELKRDLRTFGLGGACGFAAGALLVSALVWQFGPQGASTAKAPSTDRWQDGMGEIDAPSADRAKPTATAGHIISAAPSPDEVSAIRELEKRDLDIPVEGVHKDQLTRSFADARSGTRTHRAIDIQAPRNTPVKAVDDGRIAKLFDSKGGGITVYQFDPSERFCYYYAHLERYADGLHEGDRVSKGQVLGYVGTSGNAPRETPHLHFAVFRLTAEKRWWEGAPLDPYDILR